MPGDEREQRWMIRHALGDDSVTGPAIPSGESIEVVPASRLAEAEAERDALNDAWRLALERKVGEHQECRRDRSALADELRRLHAIRDEFGEPAELRASLERAREALEEIARLPSIRKTERVGAHELVSIREANAIAQAALDALAALPVVERTEDR